MTRWLTSSVVCAALVLAPLTAFAETRTVGAGKQNATLAAAAALANPGDVIEVYDDQTYAATADGVFFKRPGQANAKITIRGMRNAQGKRPKLSGGNQWTVIFNGSHYVFEGFEVTGGKETCIIHKADDITIRDTVIHDCPKHGLLGTDEGSGSLTLEYVEVYKAGSETPGDALKHPIYVATDASPTTGFPGSVFRMQHCWVHDAVNGNNVKTRAQRNEIRYNWIEGAGYYELELIGPDGPPTDLAREDSEVVGNVLVKKNTKSYAIRIGGDGTGETKGRYRFLNNTIILTVDTGVMRAQDGVESLEFSNNAVFKVGGGAIGYILRQDDAVWAQGQPRISGANNWFPMGSDNVPKGLTGTIFGNDPGFTSATTSALDLRLSDKSALLDKGIAMSPPAPNAAFPNPLPAAELMPAQRAVPPVGAPPKRPKVGLPDIGAFEFGSDASPGPTGTSSGDPPPGGSSGTSTNPAGGTDATSSGGSTDSGCGCRSTPTTGAGAGAGGLAIAALALARLRARRRDR